MEPIVIYLDNNKDEIKLTKRQFEKYIKDAYKQGYDNGYAEGRKTYWYPYWTNGTISTNNIRNPYPLEINYGTATPEVPHHTQVTCNTSKTFAPGGNITDPGLFIHGDDAIEKVVCDAHNDL